MTDEQFDACLVELGKATKHTQKLAAEIVSTPSTLALVEGLCLVAASIMVLTRVIYNNAYKPPLGVTKEFLERLVSNAGRA